MKLEKEGEDSPSKDLADRLTTVLKTSQTELKTERERLQKLEKEIKWNQIVSRSLGFIFYIGIGGVFGALLADEIKIGDLSEDIPAYFKSIIIGATWTSYLSTIGFRTGQKRADETIKAGLLESTQKFNNFKDDVLNLVTEEVKKVEKKDKVDKPVLFNDVVYKLSNKMEQFKKDSEKSMDLTRQMAQRDMNGII